MRVTTTSASTVTERISVDRHFFAVEFFPPKDDQGEAELWRAIRRLEVLDPAYVSVTYGAGGSSRDRTVRTVERIASDTTLCSMAHLTAVSHSVDELRHVIGSLAAAGVCNIMALRGDPPGDPLGEWVKHPEGLEYADERWTVTTTTPLAYYKTGSYLLLNLAADYAVTDQVTATVGAQNLGDQDYQLTDGFPEAGRSFYVSLRARF